MLKISISDFLSSRKKISAAQDISSSFKQFQNNIKVFSEKAKKVYLNEFGNEVHINGPKIAIVQKTETLKEKVERLDRLAQAVRASRSAMMGVFEDMGVRGIDKNGQPVFDEEDPDDFSLLDDVQQVDEFGDIIANSNIKPSADAVAPAVEPAAPTAKPALEQAAEASDDDASAPVEGQ